MLSSKDAVKRLELESKKIKIDYRFDLNEDAVYLDWIFQQFVEGELTGLIEGSALQKAPTLSDSNFLASQVQDEIKHAQIYFKQMNRLRKDYQYEPLKISLSLKALVKPVSGRLWQEHVFLDKAIGELYVLYVMIALKQALSNSRMEKVLDNIAKDEVQHIHFGETQTQKYVEKNKFYKSYLLGLFLRNDFGMNFFNKLIKRFFEKKNRKDLSTMSSNFYEQSRTHLRNRIDDLLGSNISSLSGGRRAYLVIRSQCLFLLRSIFFRWFDKPRLRADQSTAMTNGF